MLAILTVRTVATNNDLLEHGERVEYTSMNKTMKIDNVINYPAEI